MAGSMAKLNRKKSWYDTINESMRVHGGEYQWKMPSINGGSLA